MKKGFTLTELLIALGVIGVLAAVLMPVVHSIIPNQNVMMAKRAFYTVQTAVSDLINDSACYPDKTQAPGSERRVGFDDGYGYENCLWGRDLVTSSIETEGEASSKFATLFYEKIGANDDRTEIKGDTDSIYVSTKDGMRWNLKGHSYALDSHKQLTDGGFYVVVDVNGSEHGDNCVQKAVNAGWSECSSGKTPDSFTMVLTEDGQVKVYEGDTWAVEAVKANANLTGK